MDKLALLFVSAVIACWVTMEVVWRLSGDTQCDKCNIPRTWEDKVHGICYLGIIVFAVAALFAVVD